MILPFLLCVAAVTLAADQQTASPTPGKVLHAFVARDKNGEPVKKFLSGIPKIYGFWKGETLQAGDIVRAVWVAEAFTYAPTEVRITEAEVTAYKPDDDGIFSLVRPVGGWPLGRYRLEFYVRNKLVETVRFAIDQDVTVEIR